MKIPTWLWIFTRVFVILWILGFGFDFYNDVKKDEVQFLSQLSNLAVLVTLIALLYYVYYTYLLARDVWAPSASFLLLPPAQPRVNDIPTELHSYCKRGLLCWCNIHPKVDGVEVKFNGYYGGEYPMSLQPLDSITGSRFKLEEDILTEVKRNIPCMVQNANSENKENQLTFDVEFWYKTIDDDEIFKNPRQKYHYDFKRETLIFDG